jgi:hypothetical protein
MDASKGSKNVKTAAVDEKIVLMSRSSADA